jgi:acylphosphatase
MSDTTARTNKHKAAHITVHGTVQGVGFRHYTRLNAQRQGVVGWVRNKEDGTVEIWAEGTQARLKPFIEAVRRGPTHSHVSKVDLDWREPQGDYHSFRVRY